MIAVLLVYVAIAALIAYPLSGLGQSHTTLHNYGKAFPLALFWGPLLLWAVYHIVLRNLRILRDKTNF